MDFKKDALKMLDEMSGIETKEILNDTEETVLSIDVDNILENLDQEIENIESNYIENNVKEIVNGNKPKFLGKLYETPNPMEYPEGTMYKNTRNGVVYIKEGNTWEYLVEDGKPGAQGRAGAAGSGVGITEINNIINEQVLTQVQPISSTTDQITYVGKQAGWNERIIFQKYFGTTVTGTAQTVILASATGSELIDGSYTNSLYGIPPVIRGNFLDNKHKWIKSHFMFGLNMGATSGAYVLIDEYWGDTKMCTVTADYSYFPSPPTTAQNFPMEVYIWYNWASGPASAAEIRVHMQMTTNNVLTYDSVTRARETYYSGSYPIVDLTKDLPISWQAKWNLSNRSLYVDTLEYVS